MDNTDSPEQAKLKDEAHKLNPLAVMQPGEKVVCIINRHPVGLVVIYSITFLLILVACAAAVVVTAFLPDLTADFKLLIILGALLVTVAALIYAFTGAIVYNGNRWIVTSDSITSIRQLGLFVRHTSQLSLANLEDVSVDQNSFLQEMLGYGSLRVESAGEHTKFVFPYCPTPNQYARQIIAAHEEYIANSPAEMYAANKPLATVKTFNQPTDGNASSNA